MIETLILVGDEVDDLHTGPGLVVHWSKMSVPDGEISLPTLTNENSPQLKADYLSWLHRLGEFSVGQMSIAQHMMIYENLSAWWMSLIAEKSPFKTRAIFNVYKLRTFELLQTETGARRVLYCGPDSVLATVLRDWCQEKELTFEHHKGGTSRHPVGAPCLGRRLRFLPHPVQALIYFLYKWFSLIAPLRTIPEENKPASMAEVATVATYFPNLDPAELEKGNFRSDYWRDVHAVLNERPERINWIWLFNETSQLSIRQSEAFANQLNARKGKDRFFLVQQFLGFMDFFRILKIFARLSVSGLKLAPAASHFRLAGSSLNFYPVMESDWCSSLRGIAAIDAVLHAVAFDNIARLFSTSGWVAHTFENQPWEQAHMTGFRRHSEAKIIAHQHEVIKINNLRLFSDPKRFELAGPSAPPVPDFLAVGGEYNRQCFTDAGFPAERISVVEAPRLQSFFEMTPVSVQSSKILLVVCGGFIDETRHQLELLSTAAKNFGLGDFDLVLIKGHLVLPVQPILDEIGFEAKYELTNTPLTELWPISGATYLANSTAAVVEGVFAQIPCIVCGPYDDLDMCPAAGIPGVRMVVTPQDLSLALEQLPTPEIPADFIILDPTMARWEKLISGISHL